MGLLSILLLSAILVGALALLGVSNFYSWLLYLLEKDKRASIKYLLYALVLFIPAPIYAFWVLDKFSIEILSKFAIIIFIVSSLFGLSIFLLFIHFLFEKRVKNTLITLFIGGVIFLFFALSAYFSFAPLVHDYYANKKITAQQTLKSCHNGNAYDCFKMAQFYQNAEGVKQDNTKAIEMYKKAMKGNSRCASFELGVIYEKGEIVEKSFKNAVGYYEKACQLGSLKGCLKLAYFYQEGRGVNKDREKAEAIFFDYCMSYIEEACEAYLEIHPSKALLKYSTKNEFNGKLVDDPSSWSRAFASSLPGNIEVLKSLFKSSSGLCCSKYWFYFKLKMSQQDLKIALLNFEKLDKKEAKKLEGIFPTSFNFEGIENYDIYQNRRVTIFVDKNRDIIYLYGYVYVEGK